MARLIVVRVCSPKNDHVCCDGIDTDSTDRHDKTMMPKLPSDGTAARFIVGAGEGGFGSGIMGTSHGIQDSPLEPHNNHNKNNESLHIGVFLKSHDAGVFSG